LWRGEGRGKTEEEDRSLLRRGPICANLQNMTTKPVSRPFWRRRRWQVVALVGLVLAAIGAWIGWAENNPEKEHELRTLVQDRLYDWFPEQMALPEGQVGFVPRSQIYGSDQPPQVILLHGLDEPGGIWDELVEALDEADINAWEFRYPNDQAVTRSTDLLAETWLQLEPVPPVILIGHSMGGLLIRDFVTRWRFPAVEGLHLAGPEVGGAILVGTPNQGSEWARLRVWLGLRQVLADIPEGRFSLFAGLRDGTGAAKIDLRPDSEFLISLNARSWPDDIPIHLIGGLLSEPTSAMSESLRALSEEIGQADMVEPLEAWWAETGEQLGDGVVSIQSLEMPEAPPPQILPASHRGLLVTTPLSDDPPPAIGPIVELLQDWIEQHQAPENAPSVLTAVQ